jgi:hypothetical protein
LADRAIWLAQAGALGWMDDVSMGRGQPPPLASIEQQLRAAFVSA